MYRKALALAGAAIGLGGLYLIVDRAKKRLGEDIISDSISTPEVDAETENEFDLSQLGELSPAISDSVRLDRVIGFGSDHQRPQSSAHTPVNKNGYFNRGSR